MKRKNIIALKNVGGRLRLLEVPFKYKGDCLKYFGLLDGSTYDIAERSSVSLLTVSCSDKGTATNVHIKTSDATSPIRKLKGRTMFVRVSCIMNSERFDYELESLTDEDIKYICDVLSTENQTKLEKEFYINIDDYVIREF